MIAGLGPHGRTCHAGEKVNRTRCVSDAPDHRPHKRAMTLSVDPGLGGCSSLDRWYPIFITFSSLFPSLGLPEPAPRHAKSVAATLYPLVADTIRRPIAMKTQIERESPTTLRLLIEVEPGELAPLYEQTLKRLGREVNVKGFRKGKVPRPVLETKLGKAAINEEVLKDALPALYARAAAEEEVKAITLPDIEVKNFQEGAPLEFTATVEVRPEISLPKYTGIEVERPSIHPTQEELDEHMERLRDRFGTLEPVGRPASERDFVTIDLNGYRHDEKIEEATAQDLLYEVGSGTIVPELDQELLGKRAGDIFKFNATLPEGPGKYGGEEISFTVIVKEVQAKRLPDLNDEFAKTASEFETLEELKEEIAKQVEVAKSVEADIEVRNLILEDLIDRSDIPIPESMISSEVQHRLTRLLNDLREAGVSVERYLQSQGATEEQLVAAYRKSAERSIAAELILEAVAAAEGIEVTDEEVSAEIEKLAQRVNGEAPVIRKQLEDSGRVARLAGDILSRKALNFLVEKAEVANKESDNG